VGRACNRNGEKRNSDRIFGEKPEETSKRSRRRSVDNNKMDLREIGWDFIGWIDLAQNRDQCRALVNKVMNFRGFIKCWEILE
jgi:hypothetical protein